MEIRDIINIKVGQLYPHPENPRKDIGDVSELAESIKKNGIMQNLTVIPIDALSKEPEEQVGANEISLKSDFHVLIGHRRLAAAKMAGLSEVPCKIVSKISRKEQLSTMLEENMQRSDLTIYEQAQGFQMMLDLGETEDSIAEKTGFSKTTIRRRLNIAKLDQEVLKEKDSNEGFQLNLTDLYELERVKDVKTRDKILKDAKDSRDIVWRVQSAVKDEERKEKAKQIIPMLKKMGIEKAPDKYSQEQYSGKWEVLKEIEYDDEVPNEIKLKKCSDPLFYYEYWRGIKIIKKVKKEKKEDTPEEIARKQRDKNKKEIKALITKMDAIRRMFIENIISGKIAPVKDSEGVKDAVWRVLVETKASLYPSYFKKFFTGKYEYDCTQEEKDEAQKKVDALSAIHQMLVAMHNGMENMEDIYDYYGVFKDEIGSKLKKGYEILEKYGWSFEEEDEKLLNGTHELYTVKENKGEES